MTEDVSLQREPPCMHVTARMIKGDDRSIFSVPSLSFYWPRETERILKKKDGRKWSWSTDQPHSGANKKESNGSRYIVWLNSNVISCSNPCGTVSKVVNKLVKSTAWTQFQYLESVSDKRGLFLEDKKRFSSFEQTFNWREGNRTGCFMFKVELDHHRASLQGLWGEILWAHRCLICSFRFVWHCWHAPSLA